jgi:hypothetical protein
LTACTNCARTAELWLCNRCQTNLRALLNDLPGWITALQEDAYGQTRHGQSARRSTDKGSPALCKLGKDGSFKRSPGQWLLYTQSVAVEWAADVCETRNTPIPALDTIGFIRLLARHVNTIAHDPAAHVAYREFEQIRDTIERLVDRPRSPLFAGPCPEKDCGAELVIPPAAKHFQCRDCKATHLVHELVSRRLDEIPPDLLFTASEVLVVMDIIRTPLPERTWRRWRAAQHVQAAGELYGEPAYRIQDVRNFRKKWTREKTA